MNTAVNTLPVVESSPVSPELFDEDGFVIDKRTWSAEVARDIAYREGIDRLGYEHWRILHFIRDYYDQFGVAPLLRRVCRENGIQRQQMKRLFTSCKAAWRIAGLPNPGEEAKAYMN